MHCHRRYFGFWINKFVRSAQRTCATNAKSEINPEFHETEILQISPNVCAETSCRCINFDAKDWELHFPDQGYIICVYYILDWANLIYNYKASISLVSIMKVTAFHLSSSSNSQHTRHTKWQNFAAFGFGDEFNLILLSSYHAIQSMATRHATNSAFESDASNKHSALAQQFPNHRSSCHLS